MKTITTKLLRWLKEADEKVKACEQLTKESDNGKRVDYSRREV